MQQQEFNKMMLGKDAQWADLFKNPEVKQRLEMEIMNKGEARQIIADAQEPIPTHTRQEIDRFINAERKKGIKERSIRRAVKRKWNINVI